MAKRKLSDLAIAFVVKNRDDPSKVYSWSEIANLVQDEFKVQITWQGVRKSYLTHKARVAGLNPTVAPTQSAPVQNVPVAPIEPISSNSTANIDPSVGESKPQPPLPNYHEKKAETEKRKSLFESSFKRNEVLDDEMKFLIGL